jgi:RND family efflux transporter MFP subunit
MGFTYTKISLLLLGLAAFCPADTLVTVPGVTKPIKDEILSSLVAGRITSLRVQEGDRVKKGDIILELDRRMEELEVSRRHLIWEGKVELESAKARVATVQTDLQGTRRLYESTKSVSKEELNKKELEYKLSLAEVDQITLTEERERIEYEMAVEQVKRRILHSPIDGVITKLPHEVGEICQPHQPLVRVVNTQQFYFIANIEAKFGRQLQVGQPAQVRFDDEISRVTFEGKLSFISPVADPASGLQEIKAVFDNPQGEIRPGVAGTLTLDAQR